MLIRFEDDKIDETTELSNTLTVGSAVSTELDLTIKVLPGMLSFITSASWNFLLSFYYMKKGSDGLQRAKHSSLLDTERN